MTISSMSQNRDEFLAKLDEMGMEAKYRDGEGLVGGRDVQYRCYMCSGGIMQGDHYILILCDGCGYVAMRYHEDCWGHGEVPIHPQKILRQATAHKIDCT